MAEQTALISVSNKAGVERVARALHHAGYRIVSTGGTAKHLESHEIPVTPVDQVTGFPEILDGRVKTLHPKIHGGLLARRDNDAHLEALNELGISTIDVVVANLYPFREATALAGAPLESALEQVDIGGPTMVRAAAKNFPHVSVVTDPNDYDRFIETLASGGPDDGFRRELAVKAFTHTASYDAAIASYLGRSSDALPSAFSLHLELVEGLRYGENPHQSAGLYCAEDQPEYGGFLQLHGKALSYNNIVDLDAAHDLVQEFEEPAATIVKHTNPAGAASADDIGTAFDRALACDPVSAFGGIISLNRPLTLAIAEKVNASFFEIVSAPSYEPGSLEILMRKKNLRVMTAPQTPKLRDWALRPTALGWLAQHHDPRIELDPATVEVVSDRKPTQAELRDLIFAWRVCKHVKSNAIVFARNGATLGVGAGQMSRVDSVEIATSKARVELDGAVMASDAFFPFRDGLDAAASAGIKAVIQPGGSKRDDEVITACNEHDIAMVFTGQRHFRH